MDEFVLYVGAFKSQMWGIMDRARPNKEAMLSLLKDSNIELPDTASISQIRTAYEALVSAADIMHGQTHGVFQNDADGSPDTEKHVETAKDDERDDDEQKGEATRTRTDNVVGAQCGESDEKEFLERELQLARIKLQMLQLQLQVGEVNDKSRQVEKFRLSDISGIVGEYSGVGSQNVKKWLRLLESTIISFGGGDMEC